MINYKIILKEFYNFQRTNNIPQIDLSDLDDFESDLDDYQSVDEDYIFNQIDHDDCIIDFNNKDVNNIMKELENAFFDGKDMNDEEVLFITAKYKNKIYLVKAYILIECCYSGIGDYYNYDDESYTPHDIKFGISVIDVIKV